MSKGSEKSISSTVWPNSVFCGLICHQAVDQHGAVCDHVCKGVLVQLCKERLESGTEKQAELADPDQRTGIALRIEALNQFKISFRVSDDLADDNVFRRVPETNASAAAANIFQIAKLAKLTRGLQKVGTGDAVGIGNVFYADKLAGMQRTEHQRA